MATKSEVHQESVWNAESEPLLKDSDRRFLLALRDHPAAPRFNYACGDMLDETDLAWVQQFEMALRQAPPRWLPGVPPDWVAAFAQLCLSQVPFYQDYGHDQWSDRLPTFGRSSLLDEPDRFVPLSVAREQMMEYTTSGTTGNTMRIMAHPVSVACYLPLLRKAVERHGGHLRGGPGRVAIMLVFYQNQTLTYPSLSTFLGGAAYLKLNLHENQWRRLEDRKEYLEACNPEVLSGNPLSLGELARLDIELRPSAIISTSMALLPGARRELEQRFACPVIDFFSMTECRCLASRSSDPRYGLLAHDVYIEILDEEGRLCPPGGRGEITLTGGRNHFLPLLRYRTGDFAAMTWEGDVPYLIGLEGRAPVRFYRPDGSWLNNIDVTGALQDLSLRQFSLHQKVDGSLFFLFRSESVEAQAVGERLHTLFGPGAQLELERAEPGQRLDSKWISYTSDMPSVTC